MDTNQFDLLAKALAGGMSRRTVLRGLGVGGLAAILGNADDGRMIEAAGASYVFRLDQFHIDNTRAWINDTDQVQFAIQLNGTPIPNLPRLHRDMGDVNNGDHHVDLAFAPLQIDDPNATVTIAYVVANVGYDRSNTGDANTVLGGLGDLCEALCGQAFGGGPEVWKTVNKVWHAGVGIFTADCDGLVAADTISFTVADLERLTAAGTYREERRYPGTDSAVGCGSNSNYTVTWSIDRLPLSGGTTPPWQPWIQIQPAWLFDKNAQHITALARGGHVDLFVIGFDDKVYSTYGDTAADWAPWYQIQPGTFFDHSRQLITAVARTPDRAELFTIGADNTVMSTYFDPGSGWAPWYPIQPAWRFDKNAQHITALARNGHVDLFVIGFDDKVYSTYGDSASDWAPWYQIQPAWRFDHGTQRITAAASTPDRAQLFVIGFDDKIYSTYFDAASGWAPWYQVQPGTLFDHSHQEVTAVTRTPNEIDLITIGADLTVSSTSTS